MAHLLRGKQAGISNDLSAGLGSSLFHIDDVSRYGINSQASALAYDPVQSLLAVGTRSSQFGPGQIYIFGRGRIQVVLQLPRDGVTVSKLQFCADKLIALDSRHEISIYSLELKRLITSYSPPGSVTALCTDPMLDYAFLGMQTGEVLAYDLDREQAVPFRIPLLWQEIDRRARVSPIVCLQLHPRDVGTLLIGYTHGAVIYSFKANKALRFYQYEVPRGAPGGDANPATIYTARHPKLTQALWHPTGTFVMTGHEDGSIVFWDTIKDGRMIAARTLTETNIAQPGAARDDPGSALAVREPLFKIAWCANKDPDDTAILIAGGASSEAPVKGLCLFEMGRTPVYQTCRWEDLMNYFDNPKRQRILPTPPGAEVIDFCLIPRETPHFDGAHDPIAVVASMASGEILTMTFPSGMPITPTNQLHVSLTFVSPFVKSIRATQIGREKWHSLQERRSQGPPILRGGAGLPGRPARRSEKRNVVQAVHADGTIRIWDAGYGDEIENEKVLQVDVGKAVGNPGRVDVTQTSLAGESSEIAVGLASGELVVFRWGVNRHAGMEPPAGRPNQGGALTNITDRVEPSLQEGLVPLTLLNQQDGPVRAVCMSEIGFVAAGFEGGSIVVVDLRGPAIIYNTSLHELNSGSGKGGSLRRRGTDVASKQQGDYATSMEFSIMTLEHEDYSSILLHVGTNFGKLATFKILPDPSGRFGVQYAGSVSLDGKVIHVAPVSADDGSPAGASQQAMAALRTGYKVNGAVISVTTSSIHIFKPATAKGAHKSFDNFFCDAAGVVQYQDRGHAILGLFGDGTTRAYAIPSIREIASVKVSDVLDVRRFSDAAIIPTGNILGFTGPSELALLNVFGTGENLTRSNDKLFNPEALIPPRPTISNVQWITGTQYITPADMDVLIGGPNRPPSKRMIEQARADDLQRRRAGGSAAMQQDEGYWAYMQRQIQERTERLGFAGDGMNDLEENSRSWLNDVNKFVKQQKQAAATGVIKAKFGF